MDENIVMNIGLGINEVEIDMEVVVCVVKLVSLYEFVEEEFLNGY